EVRGVRLGLRLQPGGAGQHAAPAALSEAAREDRRPPGREADRVPDAADDAEGALRAGESRTLRSRVAELHAFYLANPPLPRSRRPPRVARDAPCGAERRGAGGVDRGAARGRAAHIRDGAPR